MPQQQKQQDARNINHDAALPTYSPMSPPSFSSRASSESSRTLQESEISNVEKNDNECRECCSHCLSCFGCYQGADNCTGSDKDMIGTLLVILMCGCFSADAANGI